MHKIAFIVGFVRIRLESHEYYYELRGWRRETGLSPPVKYFTGCSKVVLLLWIFYVFFCLVFAMPL